MRDLNGKLALVTGGAGGLGRAVGHRLAAAGARLVLWDRDDGRLAEAADELRKAGAEVATMAVDIADPAAVRETAERVRREVGEVDLLDNNVGIVTPGEFLDATEAELDLTVDVNFKAYMWCTRAFLPGMVERGSGHIIWIASAAGLLGVPGLAAYSATKHAVVGLAESIRLELRNRGATGIGTTIVCPSFIATGMFPGVKPPRFSNWLSPDRIADKIVAAVRADKLYVREPFFIKLVPLLKAVPWVAWTDFVGESTGMHRSMEGFGKKPAGRAG